MSKRPRRNQSPAFKAKVALAAVRGEKAVAELAQQYDVSIGSTAGSPLAQPGEQRAQTPLKVVLNKRLHDTQPLGDLALRQAVALAGSAGDMCRATHAPGSLSLFVSLKTFEDALRQ